MVRSKKLFDELVKYGVKDKKKHFTIFIEYSYTPNLMNYKFHNLVIHRESFYFYHNGFLW